MSGVEKFMESANAQFLKYRREDTAAGLRLAKKISEEVGAQMAADLTGQTAKPGMLDGFTLACTMLAEQFEAFAVHLETGEVGIPSTETD